MRLDGKIALISGGAGGIGSAIADLFRREGATVVVGDVQVHGHEKDGQGRLCAIGIDLLDPASVTDGVDAVVREFGRLDVLVNCAAVGAAVPFLETSVETFDRVLGVNLRGTFLVCQAAARHMVKRGGGSIVNLSSQAGEQGNVGRTAYGSSKAGLVMLTKVIAVELASAGVRANAISPGPIETPLNQQMQVAGSKDAINAMIPMGRFGQPYEVANAALFLASDEASYVSGHVLHVDGGWLARGLDLRRR